MVLIGPSGSGKTSTCAKLAAFYTYSLGKKVSWISADTVRTAAIAEARTYSDALGLPLRLTYTPNEMSDAIEEQEGADLVLIDTPGCNPRQEDRVVELGSFLTRIPNRGTYLVAAATTKETDINQALASFGPFHVKGLIVTKTDETTTFGSIYNIAAHTQTALTFFTTGDQVIGNLRAANSSDLVDAIFKGKFNA
jgi:flagellar biosynthesis protein FlhF